ncbi:MAG TPA: glucosaminidase domain-containing protein [Hyphomicrobiaceae bacterium]|jgi:hypothetical protein|nr:glucosaminidase domain-containing protein [Hyphomicrobiaceae bacterium]
MLKPASVPGLAFATLLAAGILLAPARVQAASPEIQGVVAPCVTPERLMRFLAARNPRLDPRYRDIATYYKQHGEALHVRWDYAFFQMLLETNNLTFRRGDGRPGDVRAWQNNFAGIGATGRGAHGDHFPSVSAGVLAQLQHLLAYSGQRIDHPVSPRTRENQDWIVAKSQALGRPVRFADLTRRWATDRHYGRSIEAVADDYRRSFCLHEEMAAAPAATSSLGQTRVAAAAAPPPGGGLSVGAVPAPRVPACDVFEASFGGSVALLIRAISGTTINYTVLDVDAGQEQSQADLFIQAHAHGGEAIGWFPSREQAVSRAFQLCPGHAP